MKMKKKVDKKMSPKMQEVTKCFGPKSRGNHIYGESTIQRDAQTSKYFSLHVLSGCNLLLSGFLSLSFSLFRHFGETNSGTSRDLDFNFSLSSFTPPNPPSLFSHLALVPCPKFKNPIAVATRFSLSITPIFGLVSFLLSIRFSLLGFCVCVFFPFSVLCGCGWWRE